MVGMDRRTVHLYGASSRRALLPLHRESSEAEQTSAHDVFDRQLLAP
jgi:hypothetical protein